MRINELRANMANTNYANINIIRVIRNSLYSHKIRGLALDKYET